MQRAHSIPLKTIIFFWALLIPAIALCQMKLDNLKFKPNTIYIFSRGTKTKSGLIAEKFNVSDPKITHVGLGFLENKSLRIYNVIDADTTKTALIVDNLKMFINDSKIYYLSIWECDNTKSDFEKIRKKCVEATRSKIYFDFDFSLTNNSWYCSEFCASILKSANPRKFDFMPRTLELEGFYKTVLNRGVFVYYPVDFFEENKSFRKIFEVEYKKSSASYLDASFTKG